MLAPEMQRHLGYVLYFVMCLRYKCFFLILRTSCHRRRLHRGNRELRPGTYARTGANVAFCPGTFHSCALIFKVNVAALLAKFD